MDFTPAFSIVFLTEDVFFSYSSLIAVPIASLSAVKLIFAGALVNIPAIAGLSIPVHPLKSTSVKLVHPLNILAVLVRFGIFASVMDTLSSLLCPFSIPSMLVTPLNPLQPFSSVIWSFLPNTLQPLERPDKSCTVLFKFQLFMETFALKSVRLSYHGTSNFWSAFVRTSSTVTSQLSASNVNGPAGYVLPQKTVVRSNAPPLLATFSLHPSKIQPEISHNSKEVHSSKVK